MVTFKLEAILQALHLRPRPKTEYDKRYGTFNRRMIAASIDSLLITMLFAPLIDYIYLHYSGPPTLSFQEVLTIASHTAEKTGEPTRALIQALKDGGYWERMVVSTKWQYYTYAACSMLCWHFWSATPGKLLCRLRVVDAATGKRVSLSQSLLRALGYLPSALCFGLGFFWIGFNKKRRGWHDYLAGTEVVIVDRT